MKVKTLISIKYKGKTYPPGQSLDVTKEVGEELIRNNQATDEESSQTPSTRLNSKKNAGEEKKDE